MVSEIEIRKKSMEKAYRAQVRLRYSILADEEIARSIEEVRDVINSAIASGKKVQLTPAEITVNGESVAITAA